MTEHSHKFRVEWYADGIERGVCDCGEIRYYSSTIETVDRVNRLNKGLWDFIFTKRMVRSFSNTSGFSHQRERGSLVY